MSGYFSGPWQYLKPHQRRRAAFKALARKIVLYDLGAAGGTPPPFCFLLDDVELVNFEPDDRVGTEEHGDLLSMAIGPEQLNKLYLNRRSTTSSLLRPHRPVVDRYDWSVIFKQDIDIFETVDTVDVETRSLDDVIEIKNLPRPDFLKVDVQGLSLEVLKGGQRCLGRDLIGIQIEVEFIETYAGQKTFGAVHEFLLDQGFEIFRLTNLTPWYYKTNLKLKMRTGQDTFCDLLYFRRIDSIDQGEFWTPDKARQALRLLLLHDLTDASAAFLDRFRQKQLIGGAEADRFAHLIANWKGSLDYLYDCSWTAAIWRLLLRRPAGRGKRLARRAALRSMVLLARPVRFVSPGFVELVKSYVLKEDGEGKPNTPQRLSQRVQPAHQLPRPPVGSGNFIPGQRESSVEKRHNESTRNDTCPNG